MWGSRDSTESSWLPSMVHGIKGSWNWEWSQDLEPRHSDRECGLPGAALLPRPLLPSYPYIAPSWLPLLSFLFASKSLHMHLCLNCFSTILLLALFYTFFTTQMRQPYDNRPAIMHLDHDAKWCHNTAQMSFPTILNSLTTGSFIYLAQHLDGKYHYIQRKRD